MSNVTEFLKWAASVEAMFVILIGASMALFAVITGGLSRRTGSGISRHPYNDFYGDATRARDDRLS